MIWGQKPGFWKDERKRGRDVREDRVTITFLWGRGKKQKNHQRKNVLPWENNSGGTKSAPPERVLYLSSKTKIISPLLKVSSLSSTASKSYRARTFLRLGGFWAISAAGYKGLVSICCCFCSCKDNSIAAGGAERRRTSLWGLKAVWCNKKRICCFYLNKVCICCCSIGSWGLKLNVSNSKSSWMRETKHLEIHNALDFSSVQQERAQTPKFPWFLTELLEF